MIRCVTSVWEKDEGYGLAVQGVFPELQNRQEENEAPDDAVYNTKDAIQNEPCAESSAESVTALHAELPQSSDFGTEKETETGAQKCREREQHAKKTHPAQEKRRMEQEKAERKDGQLLSVQVLLCVLIAGFVLIAKNCGAPFVQDMRTQYRQMMTQGIEFSPDDHFARFAESTVRGLRMEVQQLAERLENEYGSQSAGGAWPVTDTKKAPQGATFEKLPLAVKLSAPVKGYFTSGYGFRKNPVTGKKDFHAGIDLAAAKGTPVYAAQAGQVVRAGYHPLRGSFVEIRHAGGVSTLYQHLSYSFVRAGETIYEGECIAQVGSTGLATGPHLHLEVRVDGICTDPAYAFPQLVP